MPNVNDVAITFLYVIAKGSSQETWDSETSISIENWETLKVSRRILS